MARSILDMEPDERAAKGVFLAFQYPMEIPGVAGLTFLRTALNALKKKRGETGADDAGLYEARQGKGRQAQHRHRDAEAARSMSASRAARRSARKFCRWRFSSRRFACSTKRISGLDIDALRIVSEGVNALRAKDRAFLVITHYQRLLNHIVPDKVHVLADGRIQKTGGKELALELEKSGYADYTGKAA